MPHKQPAINLKRIKNNTNRQQIATINSEFDNNLGQKMPDKQAKEKLKQNLFIIHYTSFLLCRKNF